MLKLFRSYLHMLFTKLVDSYYTLWSFSITVVYCINTLPSLKMTIGLTPISCSVASKRY